MPSQYGLSSLSGLQKTPYLPIENNLVVLGDLLVELVSRCGFGLELHIADHPAADLAPVRHARIFALQHLDQVETIARAYRALPLPDGETPRASANTSPKVALTSRSV